MVHLQMIYVDKNLGIAVQLIYGEIGEFTG
jgi:hypothetical protein